MTTITQERANEGLPKVELSTATCEVRHFSFDGGKRIVTFSPDGYRDSEVYAAEILGTKYSTEFNQHTDASQWFVTELTFDRGVNGTTRTYLLLKKEGPTRVYQCLLPDSETTK